MKIITLRKKKIMRVAILALIAICSIFIISKIATNPESYKETIKSIDDKKTTVMSVTAGAAATSTLLATVPGDITTPIANQIMQTSSYLIIVVCVLVLEKALLTVTGYLSFKFLIPIACVLLGIHTFYRKEILKNIAVKFIVFALVIVAIVPLSLKIGDMICDANSNVIEQVVENVDTTEVHSEAENTSWIDSAVEKLKNEFSNVGSYAKQKLSQFIDVIAVFIIAYCVIPIVVIITLVWLVKFMFGIKIPQKSDKMKNLITEQET